MGGPRETERRRLKQTLVLLDGLARQESILCAKDIARDPLLVKHTCPPPHAQHPVLVGTVRQSAMVPLYRCCGIEIERG
jgi:hypothetical protein